jgi:hypothetical protein
MSHNFRSTPPPRVTNKMTGMITRRLRDLNLGTVSLKGPLGFKSVLKSQNFAVGPSSK